MAEPALVNNIENIDKLHSLIRHSLRDLGIKLPKSKKLKKINLTKKGICLSSQPQEGVIGNKIFGEALSQIPCVFLAQYGYVPQFLISTADIVLNQAHSEGIFRKSGSTRRQKELRVAVEEGQPLEEPNIYDVTCMIKQFFRELPEPLFISIYQDAFLKCFQLPLEKDPKEALLRMCLLLPLEHLGTLRYTMHLLNRVAQQSDRNLMTTNNLALVVGPNLIGSLNAGPLKPGPPQKLSVTEEKNLNAQTCMIELLIKNWDQIGTVSGQLMNQLNAMTETLVTDDELDVSDDNILEDSKNASVKKKRRRSGSLGGIVRSISKGVAKLRRSTDGKAFNMSSNTTLQSETSMNADASKISYGPDMSISDATPSIMRKRRLSGEAVPFSSNKKQAILGNLPQRSALGSTPFTPATLKRDPNGAASSERLNATTPIMGTKTSRKKLNNLFASPSGNKKVKGILSAFRNRQKSVPGLLESPPPKPMKGKNIFRKMSRSRDKGCHDDSSMHMSESMSEQLHTMASVGASPRTAVSDSALDMHDDSDAKMLRGSSSSSLQDSSESSIVVVDDDSEVFLPSVSLKEKDANRRVTWADGGRLVGLVRSKSEHSPACEPVSTHLSGSEPALAQGKQSIRPLSKTDRLQVSRPSPSVTPRPEGDRDVRRSRRDEFERRHVKHQDKDIIRKDATPKSSVDTGKNGKPGYRPEEKMQLNDLDAGTKNVDKDSASRSGGTIPYLLSPAYDLNKSVASQLDDSLLEAVLPPPHGFGDQTILEEELSAAQEEMSSERVSENFEMIEVGNDDNISEAGFSTISGGTVLCRTQSGNYSVPTTNTVSSTSIGSSVSRQGGEHKEKSKMESSDQDHIYETLRVKLEKSIPDEVSEGEYVTLRHESHNRVNPTMSQSTAVMDSKGMKLLLENYNSSEEEASSGSSSTMHDLIGTIHSHRKYLDNMPFHTDVTKGKSLSAEDLPLRDKVIPPNRCTSLYISPCRKFNYKPHLEISKETHNILTRAGYMKPSDPDDKSKDFQVPVKSPTRSAHREEMKAALRSSFNERHSRLTASLRSHNRNRHSRDINASVCSSMSSSSGAANTSIPSECEKLSLYSQENISAAAGDSCSVNSEIHKDLNSSMLTELSQKISLEKAKDAMSNVIKHAVDENINTNCHLDAKSADDKTDSITGMVSNGCAFEQSKSGFDTVDTMNKVEEDVSLDVNKPKIKQAEMIMPKHDSILNVKEAGIVAQRSRQFCKPLDPSIQPGSHLSSSTHSKKARQIVRIPTVFAKSEDKNLKMRELGGVVKERTSVSGGHFIDIPNTPATPKVNGNTCNDLLDDAESDASDEGNVTVCEVNHTDKSQENSTSDDGHKRGGSPAKQSLSGRSHNDIKLLTPQKVNGHEGLKSTKSPLLESTNTATSASKRTAINLSDALSELCNPSSEALSVLSSLKPRPLTPGRSSHLKRLKKPQTRRLDDLDTEIRELTKLSAALVHDDDEDNLHV